MPKEDQNSTTKHKRWFLTASNLISAIKGNAATNFIFVLFVAFAVERDEWRTQENMYLDFAHISHRSYCCIDILPEYSDFMPIGVDSLQGDSLL